MSQLQKIEQALITLNPEVFHDLCDSFLMLRSVDYAAFVRSGIMAGKQKPIKGNPDTFMLLESGKYIFVEHSTNITSNVKKLKDDLTKCIDESKTGVNVDLIQEIIFCLNFKIGLKDIEELKNILEKTYIKLTIYGLEALALEIHLNHRDLASTYLGFPLDTGQIVSIKDFIKEYNNGANKVSTPINNSFIHRDNELEQILEGFNNNNLIILTGPAGVGKTHLAIESLNKFLKDNVSYQGYCVSYKNHALLNDLYSSVNKENNYILFIDDANRIDAFSQITGFFKSERTGNLKLLMTVRDYAFNSLLRLCVDYKPLRIDISKLNNSELEEIVKNNPYNIKNTSYLNKISEIANGNPRLAIMAARLAIKKQDIRVLQDVSELFEDYFSLFLKDNVLINNNNLKCLGLIAFFYTLPFKNKEKLEPILGEFDISYEGFIEAIDKLEKYELVELQFDFVKIPEQNLSLYFFYKCFIKEKILSIETLIINHFENNQNRFQENIVSIHNNFGPEKVYTTLKPVVKKLWNHFKDVEELSGGYVETFWYYLRIDLKEYLYNSIVKMPIISNPVFRIIAESENEEKKVNPILKLLGKFFFVPDDIKDSLELCYEYVRRSPSSLPMTLNLIASKFSFDKEDYPSFERQIILFDFIYNRIDCDFNLGIKYFLFLAPKFLQFNYEQTRGMQGGKFIWYNLELPPTEIVKSFRKKIWLKMEEVSTIKDSGIFNALDILIKVDRQISYAANVLIFDLYKNAFTGVMPFKAL